MAATRTPTRVYGCSVDTNVPTLPPKSHPTDGEVPQSRKCSPSLLTMVPMVVKPRYPFCFPFCLVTAVIDGTQCIHFRDQCLRCAAPRIARYVVVWQRAEPSRGPASCPTRPRRTPCSYCVGGKSTVFKFVRGPTPHTLPLAATIPSGSTSTPPEASEERLRVD